MPDAKSSHMIDITGKAPSLRTAVAEAHVRLSAEARQALAAGTLPKGRAEEVARVAGVMAAKQCSALIPFCHPIVINYAEVEIVPTEQGVRVRATTRAHASTGVEMEALTAVTVAALTLYDMCKALDPGATIEQVRVLSKRGGKSGDWGEEPGGTA
ncbi:MAG: cyclic pyranopterin monophosphate synthase MoaC [Armatimonadota bacterium]